MNLGPLKPLALAAALAVAMAPAAQAKSGGHVYGAVENEADLGRIFGAIRDDVGRAATRADLTRLYRRAGYLVTLSASRPWRTRFGADAPRLHETAQREFKTTVDAINHRAGDIGTEPDYADHWGGR
jgi:hypothetical protein